MNLASVAGMRGGTGRAAYGAAKAGVIQLMRVMAVELASYGITVNALAPGAIETELAARMHSESDEAAYITGHTLAVDGGFLAAGVLHKSY